MRKKRETTIKLPGLFWDNERWVPAEKYPNFTVYTDKVLAEILKVSPMRVSTWRNEKTIPFKLMGGYAVYDVNAVIQALLKAGYQQDENLKSIK